MTEPVPRAHARRTVRMASALIAGQVALCAVIGFVTFGATHHRDDRSARVESLAGAPALIPPAPPVPPERRAGPVVSSASSTSRVIGVKPPASHRAVPEPAPPLPPSPATTTATTDTAAPAPVTEEIQSPAPQAPSPGPTDTPQIRPAPSPSPVQIGVLANAVCSPANALGRTADGTPAICLSAADGKLRWRTG